MGGEGTSDGAGAELEWMRRMGDYSEAEKLTDAEALAALMKTLNGLSKPTVAQVQGAAYGGGVGLICCCDIAIASEAAQFSISEVKLGLIPAVISPYVVAAIGERQARRYALGAERFDAIEPKRIGLVHELTPPEDLEHAVDAMVGALLANGPAAMAETHGNRPQKLEFGGSEIECFAHEGSVDLGDAPAAQRIGSPGDVESRGVQA